MSRALHLGALAALLILSGCGSTPSASPSGQPHSSHSGAPSTPSSSLSASASSTATAGWVTQTIPDAPLTMKVPPTWSMHKNGHVIDAGFNSPTTMYAVEFFVEKNDPTLGDKEDLAGADPVATVGIRKPQRLDQVFYGTPMDHFTGQDSEGNLKSAYAAVSRTGNSVGIVFLYATVSKLTPAQRDYIEKTVLGTLQWPAQ